MPEDKKVIKYFRLLLVINIFWLALSFLLNGINTLVLPLQISQYAGSEGQATLLGLLTLAGLLLSALVQRALGPLETRAGTKRNHWDKPGSMPYIPVFVCPFRSYLLAILLTPENRPGRTGKRLIKAYHYPVYFVWI